jgi:hypothetical protein
VAPGGSTGQVLTKVTAADYNTNWTTPTGGGLSLPLSQVLTFSPDNTFDIGATATTRPRTGYFGTSLVTPQITLGNAANLSGLPMAFPATLGNKLAVYEVAANNFYGLGMGTGEMSVIAGGAGRIAFRQQGYTGAVLGAIDAGGLTLVEIATPATPAASQGRVYFKADHHLYTRDSTGAETDLSFIGLTQAQGDARYPLLTNPDPYPQYTTQAETDALYLPLIGGTLSGNLTFSADNARDIGASAATRPRTIYAGTSVISPLFDATGGSVFSPLVQWTGSNMIIGTTTSHVILFKTTNVNRIQITNGGMITQTDGGIDLGGPASGRWRNLYLTGSVGVKVKAGTPVDADFTSPVDGMLAVDSTASKIWCRVGGVWKGVVVA